MIRLYRFECSRVVWHRWLDTRSYEVFCPFCHEKGWRIT